MLSHPKLAAWYSQLAQHLDAGLTPALAFHSAAGPPARDCQRIAQAFDAGQSWDQVLQQAPAWLPVPDRLFLAAAARTGKVPETMRLLADRHSQIGAQKLKMVLALIYPLGVLHLALLLLPLISQINFETGFEWDPLAYAMAAGKLILPLWLVLAGGAWMMASNSPRIDGLLRWIPLLAGYRQARGLANFAYSLGTFLEAGLPIRSAWPLATRIARHPPLDKINPTIVKTLDDGQDPVPVLRQHATLPPLFLNLYAAGSLSGQLPANLLNLGRTYQDQANRRMTLAAVVYPSLLMVAVAILVIINTLAFYRTYLDGLLQIMGG